MGEGAKQHLVGSKEVPLVLGVRFVALRFFAQPRLRKGFQIPLQMSGEIPSLRNNVPSCAAGGGAPNCRVVSLRPVAAVDCSDCSDCP